MRMNRAFSRLLLIALMLNFSPAYGGLFGPKDAKEITEEINDIEKDLEDMGRDVLKVDKNLRQQGYTELKHLVGDGGSIKPYIETVLEKLSKHETATKKYRRRLIRDGFRLDLLKPMFKTIVIKDGNVIQAIPRGQSAGAGAGPGPGAKVYTVTEQPEDSNHWGLKHGDEFIDDPQHEDVAAWHLAEAEHRINQPPQSELNWDEELRELPPLYLVRKKANGEKVNDLGLLKTIAYIFALRENCKEPLRLNKKSKMKFGTTSVKKVLSRLKDLIKDDSKNMTAAHVGRIKAVQENANKLEDDLKTFLKQSESFLHETLCIPLVRVLNHPNDTVKELQAIKKAIRNAKVSKSSYFGAQKAVEGYTKVGAADTPLTVAIPAHKTTWHGIKLKKNYEGLASHVQKLDSVTHAARKKIDEHENPKNKKRLLDESKMNDEKAFPLIHFLDARLQDVIGIHTGGGARAMKHRIDMVKAYRELVKYLNIFINIAKANVEATDANKERFSALGALKLGMPNSSSIDTMLKGYVTDLEGVMKVSELDKFSRDTPGKIQDIIAAAPIIGAIIVGALRANGDDKALLKKYTAPEKYPDIDALEPDEESLKELQNPKRWPDWTQKLSIKKRKITAGAKDLDFQTNVKTKHFKVLRRVIGRHSALQWAPEYKILAAAAQPVYKFIRTLSGTPAEEITKIYFPDYEAVNATTADADIHKNARAGFGREHHINSQTGQRVGDSRVVTQSKHLNSLRGQHHDVDAYEAQNRYDRKEITAMNDGIRAETGRAIGRRHARAHYKAGAFATDDARFADLDETETAMRGQFFENDDDAFNEAAGQGYDRVRTRGRGFYRKEKGGMRFGFGGRATQLDEGRKRRAYQDGRRDAAADEKEGKYNEKRTDAGYRSYWNEKERFGRRKPGKKFYQREDRRTRSQQYWQEHHTGHREGSSAALKGQFASQADRKKWHPARRTEYENSERSYNQGRDSFDQNHPDADYTGDNPNEEAGYNARRDQFQQERRVTAATKIQANWRGHQARREFRAKRDVATKMQARWRGNRARERFRSTVAGARSTQPDAVLAEETKEEEPPPAEAGARPPRGRSRMRAVRNAHRAIRRDHAPERRRENGIALADRHHLEDLANDPTTSHLAEIEALSDVERRDYDNRRKTNDAFRRRNQRRRRAKSVRSAVHDARAVSAFDTRNRVRPVQPGEAFDEGTDTFRGAGMTLDQYQFGTDGPVAQADRPMTQEEKDAQLEAIHAEHKAHRAGLRARLTNERSRQQAHLKRRLKQRESLKAERRARPSTAPHTTIWDEEEAPPARRRLQPTARVTQLSRSWPRQP